MCSPTSEMIYDFLVECDVKNKKYFQMATGKKYASWILQIYKQIVEKYTLERAILK